MNKYALVSIDVLHSDVDRLFHYVIPSGLEVTVGRRVLVPFGKGNKPIFGVVVDITDTADYDPAKLKAINSVPDDFDVLTADTLALALWMKDKYYCLLASAIRAITPNAKANGKFPTTRRKVNKALKGTPPAVHLTEAQQVTVKEILQGGNFLLHGVTGSGKTEVYLHVIEEVLKKGQDAIVLVPEIALTPQMVNLFTLRFGSKVAVTHSRLTAGERFQIWQLAQEGEIKLVIGPRSAIFTPFKNLGLIVIDEEHEHTYHSETTPKYDTREVALKRGELTGASVVLGSATPSLESYYFAKLGKYKLLELPERINKTAPDVHIIDMRDEIRRGNASVFAYEFAEEFEKTIKNGQQVILFLNRRGFSSFASCKWCGFVLQCSKCRVNHTYHKDKNKMLCHYCGTSVPLPELCPACNSKHIKLYGMGTQKIEEEVKTLLPGVSVLRMDIDTTKGKTGHAKVLDAFRKGEAQVLIGTQMVAKGLDFPNVTLVGVIAADMSLHAGDFRAGEHTFQLLTQVSGRAGRAALAGKVYLQTYNPENYAISLARTADYKSFYKHEIAIREAMNYPPFSHVFSIMFSGTNEREVIVGLQKLVATMEYVNKRDGKNRFHLIGISPAFVSKIKNLFRWKLLLKSDEEEPLKAFVLYCIKKLNENDPLAGLTIQLTLNPIIME